MSDPKHNLPFEISSEEVPISGQVNKSSGAFQFESIPPGGIAVTWPLGISFVIMQDVSHANDPIRYIFCGSAVIVPDTVFQADTSYYIAAPQGATQTFTIHFTEAPAKE